MVLLRTSPTSFLLNFRGSPIFFSGLTAGPTYQPLVWHSNPNTPLPMKKLYMHPIILGQHFIASTVIPCWWNLEPSQLVAMLNRNVQGVDSPIVRSKPNALKIVSEGQLSNRKICQYKLSSRCILAHPLLFCNQAVSMSRCIIRFCANRQEEISAYQRSRPLFISTWEHGRKDSGSNSPVKTHHRQQPVDK